MGYQKVILLGSRFNIKKIALVRNQSIKLNDGELYK